MRFNGFRGTYKVTLNMAIYFFMAKVQQGKVKYYGSKAVLNRTVLKNSFEDDSKQHYLFAVN